MSDVLTAEEQTAFDWAVNQQFPSVAARYAKQISNALSLLMAKHKETLLEYNRLYLENSRLSDANKALENDNYNKELNLQVLSDALAKSEKRAEAAIADLSKDRKCCRCKHNKTGPIMSDDICIECDESIQYKPHWQWNDPTV